MNLNLGKAYLSDKKLCEAASNRKALVKQLRYKAVEQITLSFADLRFRFAGRSPRRCEW